MRINISWICKERNISYGKMSENSYVLQRQFSELNVMLPRGSCAALNLNIRLKRKGVKDKWDCNNWIDN